MKFLKEEYVLVADYISRGVNPYLGLVRYKDGQLYWKNFSFGLQPLHLSPKKSILTLSELIGNKYHYDHREIKFSGEPIIVAHENGKYYIVQGESTVIHRAINGGKEIEAIVYEGKEINQEIKNYHYNDARDQENYIWYDKDQNKVIVHFDMFEYPNDLDGSGDQDVREFHELYNINEFLPIIKKSLGNIEITSGNIEAVITANQEKLLNYFKRSY